MGIYNLSRTQLQAEIEILSAQTRDLENKLREIKQLSLLEADSRRELLAVVAQTASLDRAVELTLIQLRDLVHFDLAGLFLTALDTPSLVDLAHPGMPGLSIRTFPNTHPLVEQLQTSNQPVILADIHMDSRFTDWEEMQPIRSWIGIPLMAGSSMAGFLSLGSLQVGLYNESEATAAARFIEPLAELIKRVIQTGTLSGQASNLEVISRLSLALGQARSQEDTFRVILDQVRRSFGAANGAFFFHDPAQASLVVKYPLERDLFDLRFPFKNGDPLWEVFHSGTIRVLEDLDEFLKDNSSPIYQAILKDNRTALIIPLLSGQTAFGLGLLGFPQAVRLNPDDVRLIEAIAQIISTTLDRLFTLEALEDELSIQRTRLIEKTEQTAIIQERQRLARELHDSVAQLLYSQVLFSGAGLKVLRSGDLSLSEEYLSRIHQVAQQALKEMRLLVFELRPSDTLEDGLERAIQRRLDSVERRSNLTVKFYVDEQIDLEPACELALYYISMEALNNIVKHSGATEVTLSIQGSTDAVQLTIIDNGCGFDTAQLDHTAGMGLSNMEERAAAVGGKLEMISTRGQGTRIEVTLKGADGGK